MTVEDYISNFEDQQLKILIFLHELLKSYPEVDDKLRFKVPFYFRKSWICYLNPVKNNGIELAFLRANELSNDQGLLDFKKRKQVAGLTFYQTKDIPVDLVHEIFQEALILDESIPYKSKRSKKE